MSSARCGRRWVIRKPGCANQLRRRACHKIVWQQLAAQSGVESFNDYDLPGHAWGDLQRVESAFRVQSVITFVINPPPLPLRLFSGLPRSAVSSLSTLITSCDFNLPETSSVIISRVCLTNTTNILIGSPFLDRSVKEFIPQTSLLRVELLLTVRDCASQILRFSVALSQFSFVFSQEMTQ